MGGQTGQNRVSDKNGIRYQTASGNKLSRPRSSLKRRRYLLVGWVGKPPFSSVVQPLLGRPRSHSSAKAAVQQGHKHKTQRQEGCGGLHRNGQDRLKRGNGCNHCLEQLEKDCVVTESRL